MIQHINFLERDYFVLSYRRMALLAAGFLGVAVLVYGLLILQTFLIGVRSARVSEEVNQLKLQRERVIAKAQEARTPGPQGETMVRQSLEESLRWSAILKKMTREMPSGVWLVSLKSYDRSGTFGRGLILSGEAVDARNITRFLNELSRTPFFDQPVLTESKQEIRGAGKVYTYTIDTAVLPVNPETLW